MHITKEFTFDAAHQLKGMPEGHKCRRMHGHTYRVILFVEGPIDDKGIIADYAEIAEKCAAPIMEALDHQYLNDRFGDNPTTEIVAIWIFDRVREIDLNKRARVARVRLYESTTTYCEAP